MRRAVVLFGPPGCGKGTQEDILLAPPSAYVGIGTGVALRNIAAQGGELAELVNTQMSGGGLVDDAVVNQVVEAYLARLSVQDIPVFDGYPRNLAQAKLLLPMLVDLGFGEVLVIHLHISKELGLLRLLSRIKEFRKRHEKPRSDDKKKTFLKRQRTFDEQTMPAVDFFRMQSLRGHIVRYVELDGVMAKGQVAMAISRCLAEQPVLA